MLALDIFSGDRADGIHTGVAAATLCCDMAFPPRPEDPTGALVPTLVATEVNRRVSAHMRASADDVDGRRWWMEGMVLGFAEQTVASLHRSSEFTHDPVDTTLRQMGAAVSASLSNPSKVAATNVVFAVLDAAVTGDGVALAWATENLWRPNLNAARDELSDRVRSVISCAVMTVCAAWHIEVGVTSQH